MSFPTADPTYRTGYAIESPGHVVTPIARITYVHLLQPRKPDPEDLDDTGKVKDSKYECTLLFAPDADLTLLKNLAHAVCLKRWGSDYAERVNAGELKLRLPFRDQSEQKKPGFVPGSKYISTKAYLDNPPQVTGPHNLRLTEATELYSGCYGRAIVRAWAYPSQNSAKKSKGNQGVSFLIAGFQKISDGEPLVARVDVAGAFKPVQGAPVAGPAAGNAGADIFA